MVRHILVYNMVDTDPLTLLTTSILLAVLIGGIILVKPESPA